MTTAHELTCRELVELVTDYLEGAMPVDERVRFEAHLATCQGCTNYVEQMLQTVRLTGRLTEEQMAPEAKEKLLNLFRAWNRD